MSDANEDTPNQASNSRTTAGGIFAGLRLRWQIRANPISDFERPFVYALLIGADCRQRGAKELLSSLGACIARHAVGVVSDSPACYVFLHSHCTWGHLATNQEGDRTDMVFIQHPEDPHSLLILENTEHGLRLDPQGKWSEIDDELVELTVEWALANGPTKPIAEDPGWKEPAMRPGKNISF